jgi:histidine triad (HIT) family protein
MGLDRRQVGSADGLDPDCDFCRIIRGKVVAYVVWEDTDALAFFPLKPAVVGHTMIVPKVHTPDYWSIDDRLAGRLGMAVLLVGRGVKAALNPDGMNLITSAGEAASQTVFHLHLHIVPRWHNDRIGRIWPPDRELAEDVKEDLADKIRRAVRAQL